VSARLADPRVQGALILGLVSGAAWVALGWIEATAPGRLAELCLAPLAGGAALAPLLAMWLLMGAAMMLPTAAPALDLYLRLAARIETARMLHIAGFAAGYLGVWAGFAAAAALAQTLAGPALGALPPDRLTGALLLLAGGYQFSAMKAACLSHCRSPLAYFMGHWRNGPVGAFRLGLGHGAHCLGCCWALMLLMLAAGAMNLAWMAALGALMLAEKTLPGAARWGRLLGLAAVLAGAWLIAT